MGPRSSHGRMWWAMQRCAVQCSRDERSRTVAYREGGALGFGGVPLRESDGQRLPVDGVGGDPYDVGDFHGQVVVCTSVREASSPDGQRTPSPVVSWSGVRVSVM